MNLNKDCVAARLAKHDWLQRSLRSLFVFSAVLVSLLGCDAKQETKQAKKPRPVEVTLLMRTRSESVSLVTAPVASWKTEEIGFEVTGRVETVVEPNTDIVGRITDKDGNLILEGTPIARINKERYDLQVKSQEAQVKRAEQAIEAARIQIESTLPAQLRAAEAEKKRAETEFERSKRLVAREAGALSDVDRDEAAFDQAVSQIEQLNASVEAQKAEKQSLEAQLLQAKEALRDAERNLKNCTLYSSFSGQIAEVSVVPGSVVNSGTPVATIQLMDPIKVEVEVSAEESRRLRNRQRLPVYVSTENGETEERDGYLYLIDPIADPLTRTFTLTLLVINERLIDESSALDIPTTNQTWRVDFEFLPGGGKGIYFVSEDAIFQDEQGYYLWHAKDLQVNGDLPPDRILEVRKARVKLGPAKMPFLGNWIFQQVEILDDQFVPTEDIIVGELKLDGEVVRDWSGDRVLFQNEGQWMLRPGDLVKVNLADNTESVGLFVPMDAIAYEMERTFLYLLDEASSTVERVEVEISSSTSGTSSIASVKAVDSSVKLEGRKYVSRGAHYLVDGEQVRPVESEDNR